MRQKEIAARADVDRQDENARENKEQRQSDCRIDAICLDRFHGLRLPYAEARIETWVQRKATAPTKRCHNGTLAKQEGLQGYV